LILQNAFWEYPEPGKVSVETVPVFQVGGLAAENVRWAESIANFKKQERTLCGDVLLITAFISYLGYLTKRYRLQLMDNLWRPYLSQLEVGDLRAKVATEMLCGL